MSWIVRNLISNSANIKSSIVETDGFSTYSIDLENDQYNNLLVIERKILELHKAGFISDVELDVLNLKAQGKTYADISRTLHIHWNGAKQAFHGACEKIAFNLGGNFTDEGYAQFMIDTYHLNEEQIQKMLKFMKG